MCFLPSILTYPLPVNFPQKSLGVSHLSMFMVKIGVNLILELLSVSLLATPILKKGISVSILLPRNFVSWDVTFLEDQNYFNHPYLEGESLWEDKKNNFDTLIFPTLELNSCDFTQKPE